MECLWYLCSRIPSLTGPGRTVLEETVDANRKYKICSNRRVLYQQGRNYEQDGGTDMTFNDIFKSSFLEQVSAFSFTDMVISLALAVFGSLIIGAVFVGMNHYKDGAVPL